MVVSAGAVQGRAVVMAVSCWPTSVPAEVSLVSTSPSGRVLCTKKFTLLGLMVGASAKKFALQAQNGRKTLFSGALGEFFRGRAGGEPCWASFVAPTRIAPGLVGSAPSLPAMVGFCTTRSRRTACRQRVGRSCRAIPPAAQCRMRFCLRTGFPSCVDGCAHLLAALQECHRFAGVFAAYPVSFVPSDTRRDPGPIRVDHLHHHTPVTLCDHPTTRAASTAITGLYVEHQSIWGASHAHQMEAIQTDEQITPITTIKRLRATAGR